MKNYWFRKPKIMASLPLVLILLFFVACGSTAPAPPEDTTTTGGQPADTAAPAADAAPADTTAPVDTGAPQAGAPTAVPAQAPAPAVTEAVGTLRIALDEVGPPKWLPNIQGAPQNSINNTTFWESLWSNKRDGGLTGVLAESWDISEDSTIWTIRLRQGIPFHHGFGEMTATDFVWTMENTVEEGTTRSAEVFINSFFAEGGGMTVLDDYTIKVDTVVPRFDLTWFMTMGMTNSMGNGIGSKKYYDEVGPVEAGTKQAVGTGPWRSVSHQTSGTWKFEAVEDHWRKTPNFAELDYIEITEESTRLANFQAGQLDTAKFNLETINLVQQQCVDCKFMSFPTGGQLFIIIHGQMYIPREDIKPLNPDLPWISGDPDINSEEWAQARKVRLAMNLAIDRQLLADQLLRGRGSPIHVYGWAGFEDKMDYLADLKYPYDPDRARQLLAEAGYPDGIEVPMALTNRPYPSTIETAEAVANMWEDAGIRTIQTRQPMSSFRAKFPDRSWEGVNSHGQAIQIEPTAVFTRFFSTKGFINYGIEHPIAEDLTNRVNNTFDDAERLELVRQFAKFLFDESLVIPTVSVFQVWPVGPEIDQWETLCCVTRNLTNLEFIPHRQ